MSEAEALAGAVQIDTPLVRRLVAAQFPQWAALPVRPVAVGGWDNRTFHLGEQMSVRLPSGPAYALQVEKEQRWLPQLAPHLPLPIPAPLGMGVPAEGYPWHWSVYGWIEGETAAMERIADPVRFAAELAGFLSALQRVDGMDGPPAGRHNWLRGAHPSVYDGETRRAIVALESEIDTAAAAAAWEAALASRWQKAPVWVHGDVAAGNLLVGNGELSAVIDFGSSGVGDPACDLAIAWTLLEGESREAFRAALPLDAGTWVRGRGWTLWKGLIVLAEQLHTDPLKAAEARRVIAEVLEDFRRFG